MASLASALRTVFGAASRELWPAFFETLSLVSAAYVGSFAADFPNFWLASAFIFGPLVLMIGYLVVTRQRPQSKPDRAVGFDGWLLGITTGFLFGATYSLQKLAITDPQLWIVVAVLLPLLFIFTWASVLAKRTAKTVLGTGEIALVADAGHSSDGESHSQDEGPVSTGADTDRLGQIRVVAGGSRNSRVRYTLP